MILNTNPDDSRFRGLNKKSRNSVMVWAALGFLRFGRVIFIEGIMTG